MFRDRVFIDADEEDEIKHEQGSILTKDDHDEHMIEVLNKLIDNKQTEEFILVCQKHMEIDINLRCQSGWNPLHFASYLGNIQIITYLLERQDVDPNATTKDGLTALHLAILNENIDVVQILWRNQRVSVNSSCSTIHGTPLFNAAKLGNLKIVYLLLMYGWNPTLSDWKAFMDSSLKIDKEITKIIKKYEKTQAIKPTNKRSSLTVLKTLECK